MEDEKQRVSIPGYEGLYFITKDGKVFAEAKCWICGNGAKRYSEEHELGYGNRRGYKSCVLYKDGLKKTFMVHRLVAMTFIPNPDNKPTIDHINRIKTDNRVENLRWATWKENDDNRGGKYAR